MAIRSVPQFDCSWTRQMTEVLKTWPRQDVVDNIEAICESWGDDSKASRVEWVINDVLGIGTFEHEECLEVIHMWAE